MGELVSGHGGAFSVQPGRGNVLVARVAFSRPPQNLTEIPTPEFKNLIFV